METVIKKIEEDILDILSDNPEHFLVEIKVKPTNNFKIFIDGDKGVDIGELVKYNRALYKKLEASSQFPEGDFSLEVSSPGLEAPLKKHRQYQKNIDRFVEVLKQDGAKIEGQLLQVSEVEIVIEETKEKARPNGGTGRSKKAEVIMHTVPFQDIKSTQIQIKF